jgi:putative Mg2+ transporter-C (MgtC) family protein
METNVGWGQIALRLFLAVVAGALIGINREEHERPAGLRTTLLVCLAACVAMIQVNLLLPIRGRVPDSYVVMDLMRLPLGILSGMGFIGAGAILRKDDMVVGVTTAATLWFVTVLGLCFGGGQLVLGLVSLGLGLIVLWALKSVEKLWKRDLKAALTVVTENDGLGEEEVRNLVQAAGYKIASTSVVYQEGRSPREIHYLVKWRGYAANVQPPVFVAELANKKNTLKVAWQR